VTSVSHTYTVAGSFVVGVTVRDTSGGNVQVVTVVTIRPATPLNVNLSASPTPATQDEVVTFTATTSGSVIPVSSYSWDFGDGTSLTTSGNVVNHVYTTSGTKTVKVTAVTTEGVSGSTQLTLLVVPLQISITVTASTLRPAVGDNVNFTATVSPPTVVISGYVWQFGDGNQSTTSGGTTSTTSHAYGSLGAKTVTVTATRAVVGTTVQSQIVITVVTN
jgi:PKD repeat protein